MVTFTSPTAATVVLTYPVPLTDDVISGGPYIEIKTAPFGIMSSVGNDITVSGYTVTADLQVTDPTEIETERNLFLDNTAGLIRTATLEPVETLDTIPYTSVPNAAALPESAEFDAAGGTLRLTFGEPIGDYTGGSVAFEVTDNGGDLWSNNDNGIRIDAFTWEWEITKGDPSPYGLETLQYAGNTADFLENGRWPVPPLVNFPITPV